MGDYNFISFSGWGITSLAGYRWRFTTIWRGQKECQSKDSCKRTHISTLKTTWDVKVSNILPWSVLYFGKFKGLRLTAGRRPSNDFWLMVWEDWADLCWAKSGPCWAIGPILGLYWPRLGLCWAMLGASWAHVGPMFGPCWPMLALCGPMLSHLGSYVGAMFGPSMLKRS